LAMLIGIGSVLGARFISLFFAFPVINRLPLVMPVRLTEQFLLAWGGVRGTVTLALALSLPLSLDYWYTIQSIAYGVVLFTLFVQTTTMPPVIKVLKLDKA
jgi:CPA1 family monovalent cation:H+ antiporter